MFPLVFQCRRLSFPQRTPQYDAGAPPRKVPLPSTRIRRGDTCQSLSRISFPSMRLATIQLCIVRIEEAARSQSRNQKPSQSR